MTLWTCLEAQHRIICVWPRKSKRDYRMMLRQISGMMLKSRYGGLCSTLCFCKDHSKSIYEIQILRWRRKFFRERLQKLWSFVNIHWIISVFSEFSDSCPELHQRRCKWPSRAFWRILKLLSREDGTIPHQSATIPCHRWNVSANSALESAIKEYAWLSDRASIWGLYRSLSDTTNVAFHFFRKFLTILKHHF